MTCEKLRKNQSICNLSYNLESIYITVNNFSATYKNNINFSGIIFDNKLKFYAHVNYIYNKIS